MKPSEVEQIHPDEWALLSNEARKHFDMLYGVEFWPSVICVMDRLGQQADYTARCHGFRLESLPMAAALIHTEVAEITEADRACCVPAVDYKKVGCSLDTIEAYKYEGIDAELADVVIRVAQTAEHYGISLGEAIMVKMFLNTLRPVRHGGKAY